MTPEPSSKRRRRARFVVAAAALAALAGVAAAAWLLLAPASDQTAGAFGELLGLIPDTPETRRAVYITDFERLRTLRDIELPTDPFDADQQQRYLDDIVGDPEQRIAPFGGPLPGFGRGPARLYLSLVVAAHVEHVGFGPESVDQTIDALGAGNYYSAALGSFDSELADRLLTSCDLCPLPPDVDQHGGLSVYSWGEDGASQTEWRLAPPAFDNVGGSFRLVVRAEYLLRTNWTDGIEDMIDASLGGPSLRDSDDFRLAAQALDEMGSFTAMITDQTQGPESLAVALSRFGADDAESLAGLRAMLSGAEPLRPYSVAGIGIGIDANGEGFDTLVLVHGSEREARESAELLALRIVRTASVVTSRPWAEQIEVVEIEADGRVLRARMRSTEGGPLALSSVWWIDPLFLHE